ncbi:hypothetical protein [Caproiciproducens sp.]
MEHSYFWPDVNGDREYTDDDYAEYAGGFATHGVQNGDLAVTAGGNMSVVIPAGRAYVGPAWKVRKYYNDSPLTLTVANADGVLNRKDTIVLRSDINTRDVTAQVITGTPASNPVAPAIVRTAEQYDLKIAEISVPAGTTAITQALITDTRLDSSVCGIVTGAFQQIDTTTFYNQIQADLASFKNVNEADFTVWVNSLKDILDAETAGNLLNMINGLQSSKADKSIFTTAVLEAANWTGVIAPYSITVAVTGAKSEPTRIEVQPTADATAAQWAAWRTALIRGGGQGTDSITLLADGDKPEIDIPVAVTIRGDVS